MNKAKIVFTTTPEAVVPSPHTKSQTRDTCWDWDIVPALNYNQIQTLTNPIPLKTHLKDLCTTAHPQGTQCSVSAVGRHWSPGRRLPPPPAILIEAFFKCLWSQDLNEATRLSQTHNCNMHFWENFISFLDQVYFPGRMIPSYFCWNQRMASSLLILCLAPMQPVLRFLSAMLNPGLPSTT